MSHIVSQQSAKPEPNASGAPNEAPVCADNSAETAIAPFSPPGTAGPTLVPMLDWLMDLELPLSIALGRSTLPIRDVLKMTPGSLIELDRRVGELVDLVVHGTTVAKGEVVSVKGNYGVRIKEIISRQDRLALQRRS